MRAVPIALVAAVAWGVWALLTKLATRSLEPEAVLVVSYLVGSAVGLGFLLATTEGSLVAAFADPVGLQFAVGAGVATGVGSVAYYIGLRTGALNVVSTVTALYFVVAAVLGIVVLGESLEYTDALAMAFAVGAVVLFTQ